MNRYDVDYTQPNEHRMFVKNDVVLFDECNQQYGMDGNIDLNIEPYTRTGIMLIKAFDYDSDIACRAKIGRSAIGKHKLIYSDFSPCGKNYRYARKCHMKKLLKEMTADPLYEILYKGCAQILIDKLNDPDYYKKCRENAKVHYDLFYNKINPYQNNMPKR